MDIAADSRYLGAGIRDAGDRPDRLSITHAGNNTFDVVVDGQIIDTITAYGEQQYFPSTQAYFVGLGSHVLPLQSRNQVIGLDAVRVFRGTENILIILPRQTPCAVGIEQVAAPSTVQATLTPREPEVRNVSVVIAYDENGNRAVDPAEGVVGISVRVIASDTNRELLQTFTDSQGYAQVQVVTDAPMRVVVPYFGRVWDMNSGGSAHFTLLLEPGTQPGLIP